MKTFTGASAARAVTLKRERRRSVKSLFMGGFLAGVQGFRKCSKKR
jgi:hypothetical protein